MIRIWILILLWRRKLLIPRMILKVPGPTEIKGRLSISNYCSVQLYLEISSK
jgi:hypothetical protein